MKRKKLWGIFPTPSQSQRKKKSTLRSRTREKLGYALGTTPSSDDYYDDEVLLYGYGGEGGGRYGSYNYDLFGERFFVNLSHATELFPRGGGEEISDAALTLRVGDRVFGKYGKETFTGTVVKTDGENNAFIRRDDGKKGSGESDTWWVRKERNIKPYGANGLDGTLYHLRPTKKWYERYSYGYAYYRTPTLDYRYIEQMANAFASKHSVSVVSSNQFAIDIEKKTLYYNPEMFMFDTKARLITSLLHEIGHLRFTTPTARLRTNDWLSRFPGAVEAILNAFEDKRIDGLVTKSYEGAAELETEAVTIAKEEAQQYLDAMGDFKRALRETLSELSEDDPQLSERVALFFSLVGHLIIGLYDGSPHPTVPAELKNIVEKAISIEPRTTSAPSTDAVLDILSKEFFPLILDLISSLRQSLERMRKAVKEEKGEEENTLFQYEALIFSMVTQSGKREGVARILALEGMKNKEGMSSEHEMRKKITRRGGKSFSLDEIPKTWAEGNYEDLRNSVASSIQELIRKLQFLRSRELALQWKRPTTRGRLDSKSLRKFPLGEYRHLYKAKLPNHDTIQSFAFSLLVDTSGSMNGRRIVDSVRAAILIGEVCNALRIPFEIVRFDTSVERVKEFDENVKKKQSRIGGLVNMVGGGTNLLEYFRSRSEKTLLERPEKKKVCILISDGDTAYADEVKERFLSLRRRHHIIPFGVSIQCGDFARELCGGEGIEVNTTSELPLRFAELLKRLILSSSHPHHHQQ